MTDVCRHPELPPDDERDPVLDVLLAEMLGDAAPPDVSGRVLAALERMEGAALSPEAWDVNAPVAGYEAFASSVLSNGASASGAVPAHTNGAAKRPAGAIAAGANAAYSRRRKRAKWIEAAMAAGAVAGCVLAVWLAVGWNDPPGERRDDGQPVAKSHETPSVPAKRDQDRVKAPSGEHGPAGDYVVEHGLPKSPAEVVASRGADGSPRAPEPGDFVEVSPKSLPASPNAPSPGTPAPKTPTPPVRPNVRSTDAEVIAAIDRAIRQRWSAATVTPSARATDTEWLRRVFLAVLGRIPKLDEIEAFLADRSPGKRQAILDQLLASERYADEFARNWTNVYTEALLGHTAGDFATDKTNRGGLQQYLRRSLLANKPYNVLTAELLTATGSTQPGAADFNGATNFLVDKLDASGVQATVKTAEVFLGVQVQCTQCHNHPFNDWKQGRFWELNAFFRQTKAIGDVAVVDGSAASSDPSSEATVSPDAAPRRANAIAARVADVDFYGEGDARDDDAEIYYEERSGRLKAAYPVFFDGTAIARSGELSQVNRRKELARLVTGSPRFAEAAVNRVWSHFFGHGFTRPIDDMGPHNPPTHPELLERLAREFAAGGYDLKSLVRWIALSEAYALSSKPSRDNQHDDPTAGNPPLFSRYYLRQMRAEQLYESLAAASGEMRPRGDGRNASDDARAASGGDLSDEAYAEREQDKAAWMRQFVIAYRTDECDECSLFVGSIPQTLAMMNGDMTAEATDTDTSGLLAKIARSPVSDAKKVQQLFLAALARNPTPGEQTAARRLIAAHGNDTAAGLEDLWWALLNSNEFIMDR